MFGFGIPEKYKKSCDLVVNEVFNLTNGDWEYLEKNKDLIFITVFRNVLIKLGENPAYVDSLCQDEMVIIHLEDTDIPDVWTSIHSTLDRDTKSSDFEKNIAKLMAKKGLPKKFLGVYAL